MANFALGTEVTPPGLQPQIPVIEDLPHLIAEHRAQEVIIADPDFPQEEAFALVDRCHERGVAVRIVQELGIPLRYVGVGEGIDDLLDFDPEAFVDGLLTAA